MTTRDHPRTRGEKASNYSLYTAKQGSPPHTRGKVFLFIILRYNIRITPAHAGKRSRYICALSSVKGSPPHTRGKVCENSCKFLNPGITPAHAGKSISPVAGRTPEGDHPRTRGEKPGSPKKSATSPGSPPHTRGKAVRHDEIYPLAGITPAHAGKSTATPHIYGGQRDHPRTRGEKAIA